MLTESIARELMPSDELPVATYRLVFDGGNGLALQVLPSGDPENTAVLRQFVTAVLAVEPDATGPAVMLYEAGNTIVRAFIEAGIFALAAIALLLWITLRRLTDVLMTGNCDAKIFAEKFSSLAEVTAYLQKDMTPKQGNAPAVKKQTTGLTEDGLPVHSFQSLLDDLATLARNTITTAIKPHYPLTVLTRPTPVQQKEFDLLGIKCAQ